MLFAEDELYYSEQTLFRWGRTLFHWGQTCLAARGFHRLTIENPLKETSCHPFIPPPAPLNYAAPTIWSADTKKSNSTSFCSLKCSAIVEWINVARGKGTRRAKIWDLLTEWPLITNRRDLGQVRSVTRAVNLYLSKSMLGDLKLATYTIEVVYGRGADQARSWKVDNLQRGNQKYDGK